MKVLRESKLLIKLPRKAKWKENTFIYLTIPKCRCCLELLMLLKDWEMNNLFNLKLEKMLAITHIHQSSAWKLWLLMWALAVPEAIAYHEMISCLVFPKQLSLELKKYCSQGHAEYENIFFFSPWKTFQTLRLSRFFYATYQPQSLFGTH